MQVLKTPESAFDTITDFPYSPCFTEVTDTVSSEITMAHYKSGPKDGHTVLLIHGEPTRVEHHKGGVRSRRVCFTSQW